MIYDSGQVSLEHLLLSRPLSQPTNPESTICVDQRAVSAKGRDLAERDGEGVLCRACVRHAPLNYKTRLMHLETRSMHLMALETAPVQGLLTLMCVDERFVTAKRRGLAGRDGEGVFRHAGVRHAPCIYSRFMAPETLPLQ